VSVEFPIVDTGWVIVNRGTNDGYVLESKLGKGVVRCKLSKLESILVEMNIQLVINLSGNSATIYIGR
jgi:hypothetical protein